MRIDALLLVLFLAVLTADVMIRERSFGKRVGTAFVLIILVLRALSIL